MVTHGTGGDVLPFTRIGAALVARGHDVTLISHAPYAAAAERAGLTFVPLDTEEEYRRTQAHTADLLAVRRPADLRRYYETHGLFDQLRREVELLVAGGGAGAVLVGRHTSALSVLVAAELTGAPAAWVAVTPVQVLVAPIAELNVRLGLAGGINAVRAGFGLTPVTDWSAWLRAPRRTLGLWPEWFDRADTPTGVALAGFVSGDATPESTVEFPGRPLLVTGGTGEALHPRFYEVALAAVEELGHPTVVVAPRRELLPARLPAGASWYPRLPFPVVMPQVGAILHHGGIGTAVRALHAGTPQVILAYGQDRPDNATRLAKHDLARWLPEDRWDPATIAAELRAALSDNGYPARAAGLADDDGPERAADLLEALSP